VEQLFAQYQSAGGDKQQVAHTIGQELTVHAQIEEEIFYPAFLNATGDRQLVDHARDEHNHVRELIARVEAARLQPNDQLMMKLQQAVDEHVREEREEMFEKARKTPGVDLVQLGMQLEQRKTELMAGQAA
jgi:hypothetical protein